jgi:urease accessory protein
MAIDASGSACLHVDRDGRRSRVTRASASSPLRLLVPRNHGDAAWVYTSTFGGGLVDGDALRMDVRIGPQASVFIGTQAATKVYRSLRGTSHELTATVERDGLLVIAPDPVVCFAEARYTQTQRIELEATAGLVLIDSFTSGRQAFGERWLFARYVSRLSIDRAGRPLVIDGVTLEPHHGELIARMRRFDAFCVVVIVGPALEPHVAHVLSRVSHRAIERHAPLIVGASPIAGGCVLKLASTSVEDLGRAVRDHLDFVPALLGDDPWARKW